MKSILGALLLVACMAAAPQVPAPDGHLREFPSFGVALTPLMTWRETIPDNVNRIIQWAKLDANGTSTAMIMIEGAKPANPTPEGLAKDLAKSWGGVVSPEMTVLDGASAFRVVVNTPVTPLHPVEAIVAFHEGHAYLVMGGVVGANTCHDEIESIRLSWKWIKFAPPSSHLQFRHDPATLALGTVTVGIPELMHTYKTDSPQLILDLGIYDLQTNSPTFFANVRIGLKVKGETFAELKDRFAKGMSQQIKLTEPFAWREISGPSPRFVSNLLDVPDRHVGDNVQMRNIWALIDLDPERIILVCFSFRPEPADELRAYMQAADAIVASVRLNEKANRTAP